MKRKASFDPVTIEIIQSSLDAISSEMFATMRKTAMSSIIYEVLDFGVAITDREGRLASSGAGIDRKSTRLNSSHSQISYAVFCLKKKNELSKLAGSYDSFPNNLHAVGTGQHRIPAGLPGRFQHVGPPTATSFLCTCGFEHTPTRR